MLKHRNLGRLRATLTGIAFILPLELLGQAAPVGSALAQDSAVYVLDRSSLLLVHAGKSGLLKGLGHEHRVRAHAFSGTVVYFPNDVGRSRVSVTVLTDSLRVVPEADSADIPEITRTMREKTLRVDSFPEITFVTTAVELVRVGGAGGDAGAAGAAGAGGAGGAAEPKVVRVSGDFTMVGRTQPVSVNLTLDISADTLRAEGSFAVKQTDFGIKPYSTALGLVKVKDEVRFELKAVAVRSNAGGASR